MHKNNWKWFNALEEQTECHGRVLWKTADILILCNIFNAQVVATPAMIPMKNIVRDFELQYNELIRYYTEAHTNTSSVQS